MNIIKNIKKLSAIIISAVILISVLMTVTSAAIYSDADSADSPEEVFTAPESPMITYKGRTYVLAKRLGQMEIPRGGKFKTTETAEYESGIPGEGRQNYSETPVGFSEAGINGVDCIAAEYDGGIYFFEPIDESVPEFDSPREYEEIPVPTEVGPEEAEDKDNAPNPATGAAAAVPGAIGIIFWAVCAASSSKNHE